MLELIDIQTYYGESYVLMGVSLEIEEGSIVALLGRNGTGKTTTIRSIMGFTPPHSGVISLKGKKLNGLEPHQISRMGLGLVPQGRRIFPSLSVRENLVMPGRTRGKDEAWSLEKVYSLFPILEMRANLRGTLLSGGEQQMLAIARTLMTNPDLLLMDEPSEGLAPLIVRHVGEIIKELNQTGLSILLVEQNIRLALGVAEYIYILSSGVVIYQSTSEKLREKEEVQMKYLGVAV
jgi:branched-chain amino acid transport system ATP-binding protein